MNGTPRRTVEHLKGLVGQLHVSAVDRATLRIRPPGGGGTITATRLDADLFSTSEGGTLAFQRDAQGRPGGFTMTGSIWDPQGFHRAGWADTQPLTLVVVALATLCLVARVGISLVRAVRRKSAPEPAGGTVARVAWRLSGTLPFLLLAVPLTAIIGMVLSPPPYVELPRGVKVAFGLLTVAAAIGALLPIGALTGLRERAWPRSRQWFFAVYACSMLGLAWALQHWSLVLAAW